jgi:hypothetical protein
MGREDQHRLDLLSNLLYVIGLLLCRKLLKEIALTGKDVRICDGNRGSGATAEAMLAVGGEETKVVLVYQARQMFKEKAKGGAPKNDKDYTPNDCYFSNNSGSHHRFSWDKLSKSPIDIAQVSMGAAVAARFAASAPATSSTINAFVLRTRKWATKKMVDLTTTLRTKKKAKLVRTALSERKPSYVSIIEDMYDPGFLSQDYLAHCMEQATQDLN